MTRSWSLAFLLSLIAPLGRSAAHPGDPTIAFVGVSVIPMDRERVVENQTVVVQGQKIVAMGPADQTSVPTNAVRIDGHEKYLMPGLADMHAHVWGGPDSRGTERLLFQLAASGVTTIRNMDYYAYGNGYVEWRPDEQKQTASLLRWRARVAAGELWAPRIYTSGMWNIDTTRSVDDNIDAYKAAGYDFIKIHDEGPDSSAFLDSIVAAARRVGLPIVGHAVGGLAYGLEHHFRSLEHLHGFPATMLAQEKYEDTRPTPVLIPAIRQAGVWICPTQLVYESLFFGITPNYRRSLPSEWRDRGGPGVSEQAKMAGEEKEFQGEEEKERGLRITILRRRLVKALQDAGVGLLLGTDVSVQWAPDVTVHHELQALVWAGLTPYQALWTGTRNVGAYFGTEDSTGTITAGKRADLILLHGNPLADIRHSSHIAGVMIAGRWRGQAEIEREMEGYAQADTSMRAWFKWP